MIIFDQEVLKANNEVTVTSDTGGNYQWASSLSLRDGEWHANPGDNFSLGRATVGGFGVNLSDPGAAFYFYSWFTILPEGDHLTLQHSNVQPPAAFQQQPAFSNDILSKYLEALLSERGRDYLRAGLETAAQAFPNDAATAVGDTVVLATVFFPEVTVPFLIGVAGGTVMQFFGHVNDAIIEEMVSDRSLTQQEGTFLKLVFGLGAFVNGLQGVIGEEEAVERAKNALDASDVLRELSSTAGEMDYGVRFNAMDAAVPSATVIIHINRLP